MGISYHSSRTMAGAMKIARERGVDLTQFQDQPVEVRRQGPPAPKHIMRQKAPVKQVLVYEPRPYVPIDLMTAPMHEARRHVMQLICRWHGISMDEMMSKDRTRRTVAPRGAAICAIAELYAMRGEKCSFPKLGRFFGGRDHTTIIHVMWAREYEPAYPRSMGCQPTPGNSAPD